MMENHQPMTSLDCTEEANLTAGSLESVSTTHCMSEEENPPPAEDGTSVHCLENVTKTSSDNRNPSGVVSSTHGTPDVCTSNGASSSAGVDAACSPRGNSQCTITHIKVEEEIVSCVIDMNTLSDHAEPIKEDPDSSGKDIPPHYIASAYDESVQSGRVLGSKYTEEDITKKSNLVSPDMIPAGEKSYFCPECGKAFLKKENLKKHIKIHTGERSFSCAVCGKCFKDNFALTVHHRIHTGEKPYSCSDCGKSFTTTTNLNVHQRIHRGEKPYSCSECGKCFRILSGLSVHQRIHTGEKPYSCSDCGKCFAHKSHLIIHQRVHTGEKPYSCAECGKCFAATSNLIAHQRTHLKNDISIIII